MSTSDRQPEGMTWSVTAPESVRRKGDDGNGSSMDVPGEITFGNGARRARLAPQYGVVAVRDTLMKGN